ncbi:MAG: HU family DNA-binding protein [Bacillota bacterium]
MNKADLAASVAQKLGSTKKDAEKAIGAVFESVEESLARGEKVALVGFGTFDVRTRPARQGRNPRTMEPINIPAAKVPFFRPGRSLKEKVENG